MVSLGPINLSHLVFNPAVDFTQLNTWNNPDINKIPWEYRQHTHTHTLTLEEVETSYRWSGREHNDLLKGELGPTWLSAGLQPVKHQGTMIPPTYTHLVLSAGVYTIWGMGGTWVAALLRPCRAFRCVATRVCLMGNQHISI